ncbi:MAG: DUF4301 family protein [Bacteroidota bacterium]
MENLTAQDIQQIEAKGLSVEDFQQQLRNFEMGFPYLPIIKPATPGDGIRKINQADVDKFKLKYEQALSENKITKFVPASGAASRMFKFLFEYLNQADDQPNEDVQHFINQLQHFAFYEDLKNVLEQKGFSLEEELKKANYKHIIDAFLNEKGLNYGILPKGLIKFHQYHDHSRTSFEEQWVESAGYAKQSSEETNIHFTISPEHSTLFEELVDQKLESYQQQLDVSIHNEYSYQKPYTDIVAVDPDNNLFRNKDGSLLFRPGGHGALLENLNDIDADLVFIKNIDNVAPDRYKVLTYEYKRALGGMLVHYQSLIFEYLQQLENDNISDSKLNVISDFLEKKLDVLPPADLNRTNRNELKDYLITKLNRPIRICGMTRNMGDPGGGPLWVENSDGSTSLQIVEKAQINMNDPEQIGILNGSTHFNPVDIVCGMKDYKGRKFDLMQYRDPSTGIISKKSKDGRELKAQELPGLWNGGMADWNTLFVEVPLLTFTPVKTVNDLLKEEHQ